MPTDRKKLNQVFGDPKLNPTKFERDNMVVWNCQKEFTTLPFKRMYVNKYILEPLRFTFTELCNERLIKEILTFDGCWMVRDIRGYAGMASIHSWAIAIDLNAAHNPLGWSREKCIEKGKTPFTKAFIDVWRKSGWVCGFDFNRKDGMHFQYTKPFDS